MKQILAFTLLGILALSAEAQTQSADDSVFGMHLGEKFSIPECVHLKKSNLYAENDSAPCYERIGLTWGKKAQHDSLLTNDTVTIRFPFSQRPPIISGLKISAQIVDGNLESIGFNTMGLQTQDQTLSALKEKYGDPTSLTELKKQNNFGATFDSHFSVWKFEKFTVVFQGTTDRVDSGLVNIDTKKGADYRSALLKKSQDGPKL
jgi:hypothetical protein